MLGKNLEPKAHGMWAMPVLEKTLAARPQKKKSRGRCGHKTWIIPAILGLCSWCLNISQSIHIHSDFQVILGLCSRSFELPTPILRSRYWRPVADFINMADVQADVAPPSGDSEILRIESSTWRQDMSGLEKPQQFEDVWSAKEFKFNYSCGMLWIWLGLISKARLQPDRHKQTAPRFEEVQL